MMLRSILTRLHEAEAQVKHIEGELQEALRKMQKSFGDFVVSFSRQADGIAVSITRQPKNVDRGIPTTSHFEPPRIPLSVMTQIAHYVLEVAEAENVK